MIKTNATMQWNIIFESKPYQKQKSELDKQVVIHVLYSIIYVNTLNWDGQVRREYDTTIVSLILQSMFKNIVCSIWLHTISNSYFSSKCKLLDYSKISYSLLGINTKFSNPCSCIEKDFTICYNSRFVLFFFF